MADSSFISVWLSNFVTRIRTGPIFKRIGAGCLLYCVTGYADTELPGGCGPPSDNAAVLRDKIKGIG